MKHFSIPSPRVSFALQAFVCIAALVIALFLEHQWQLKPCPLCLTQRAVFVLVGGLSLLALPFTRYRRVSQLLAILCGLLVLVGMVVAGRHVWLQSLPESAAVSCGPSLQYMLKVFPLSDVIRLLFKGGGDCHRVNLTVIGLSIPAWTMVLYGYLGLVNAMIWSASRSDRQARFQQ